MRVSGEQVRRARERNVLSLRELAGRAGLSYVTLWRIETGETQQARPATVRKLAAALGVEPAALIAWEDGGADRGAAE